MGQGEGTGAGEADPEFELCYLDADDGGHRELPAAWPGLRPETFMPAREFRWARSQKHLPGLWWSVTTGAHVGYESWLERDHVMLLDFDPQVTAIAAQPFWLYWRDGAGRRRRHAPDLFARMAGGSGVVIDELGQLLRCVPKWLGLPRRRAPAAAEIPAAETEPPQVSSLPVAQIQ